MNYERVCYACKYHAHLSSSFRTVRRRDACVPSNVLRVVAAGGFLLARLGEIADSFQVADDTREIVHILTAADGTLVQVAFVYMPAIVASRIGDVESEVVGTFLRCHTEKVAILRLREVLL